MYCVLIGKCFAWVIQWCFLVGIGNVAFFWCIIKLNTTKTVWLCGGALLQKISYSSQFGLCFHFHTIIKVYKFSVMAHLRRGYDKANSSYILHGPYFLGFCHRMIDCFHYCLMIIGRLLTPIFPLTYTTCMLILFSLVSHVYSLYKCCWTCHWYLCASLSSLAVTGS